MSPPLTRNGLPSLKGSAPRLAALGLLHREHLCRWAWTMSSVSSRHRSWSESCRRGQCDEVMEDRECIEQGYGSNDHFLQLIEGGFPPRRSVGQDDCGERQGRGYKQGDEDQRHQAEGDPCYGALALQELP